jgi:hypothetical protein
MSMSAFATSAASSAWLSNTTPARIEPEDVTALAALDSIARRQQAGVAGGQARLVEKQLPSRAA